MAKRPTVTSISSGYASNTQLNANFEALRDAFDNTLSLDGGVPNAMEADFDLGGNDIINGGVVTATDIIVNGSSVSASAAEAAASAAEAAATYDAFDDRYLGAKSAAPSVDNDGDALTVGALYFDTTTENMFVYTGSAWNAAYTEISGGLLPLNNLSDVDNAATSLFNLGLSATATEINVLAGITASTAELNYVSGVTSALQTQLDAKAPDNELTQLEVEDDTSAVFGQVSGERLAQAAAVNVPDVLNASGSAPVYACRAWVNFNGKGTVAIRASGNVSSITDNGAGDYTVNFTTAMSDADYIVFGSVASPFVNRQMNTRATVDTGPATLKTTSALRVIVGTAGTLVDHEEIYVGVVG